MTKQEQVEKLTLYIKYTNAILANLRDSRFVTAAEYTSGLNQLLVEDLVNLQKEPQE